MTYKQVVSLSRCIVLTCLYLHCLQAMAEEDSDTVLHINEVVVNGNSVRRSITSTVPMQISDRQMMDNLDMAQLSDAVRTLAGAEVKDYGGIGGMKTVSVRNLGAHHTAVSYDGIVISNTQSGQVDIGRFSVNGLESVSLAIGQADNLMQSARHYASGGVIEMASTNIKTREPGWWKASVRSGSFGLVAPSFIYSTWKDNDAIGINASYTHADGNYPFTITNGVNKDNERRKNSRIDSWRAEADYRHYFDNGADVSVKSYFYRSSAGLPGVVILYNNTGHEHLWNEDFILQSVYTTRLDAPLSFKVRGKFTHSWSRYIDEDVKYHEGMIKDIARQDEGYASGTMAWKPARWISIALSEDMVYNKLRNNIASQPEPERYTSLTAFSCHLTTDRLKIIANALYSLYEEHSNGNRNASSRNRLSPSISISWRLLSEESFFIRAMAKGTFRMPTFTDLYYQHIGNNNLLPERASEYGVGFSWQHEFGKKVSVSITADGYYNRVEDKIVAFPTTYLWKMVNLGKVAIHGLSLSTFTNIAIAHDMNLSLSANYNMQDARDRTDRENASYGDQIAYTPRHSGNANAVLNTKWLDIGYSLDACGERWSMGTNKSDYRLSAYWEHSMTIGRTFRLSAMDVSIQAAVHNITDRQYEIIQYYPMPGRNFTMTISLTNKNR